MFTSDREIMKVDKLHELEVEQGQEQEIVSPDESENTRLLNREDNVSDEESSNSEEIYFENSNWLNVVSWSVCILITCLNTFMIVTMLF